MTDLEVIVCKNKFSVGRIIINVAVCAAVVDKRRFFGDSLWKKL